MEVRTDGRVVAMTWLVVAVIAVVASGASAAPHRGRARFHPEAKRFPEHPSAAAIARAVAAAKRGKPETFTFVVATSLGYGCTCPPWLVSSKGNDTFIAPYFARGLPDPHDTRIQFGSYRFHGHFDGRRVSPLQWIRDNHYRRADYVNEEEGEGDFREPVPAMIVDDWCFEPWAGYHMPGGIADDVAEMKRAGRVCGDRSIPIVATPTKLVLRPRHVDRDPHPRS